MWSDARGKRKSAPCSRAKTRVLILIAVAALLTAGIIVLAPAGAAPHAACRFRRRLRSWENVAAGGFNPR